jgi:hypothetical protein
MSKLSGKTLGPTNKALIPQEIIAEKIYLLRNRKVMLDKDLAELYKVPTKVLIQSVKRNLNRFPEDFMFQLSSEEFSNLRSQLVTSSWGGRRYRPFAFTELGVAMLSSVLKSEKAILVNISIMRTFAKLREILSSHKELAYRLQDLGRNIDKHDEEIAAIFNAIQQLVAPKPTLPKRKIGFR